MTDREKLIELIRDIQISGRMEKHEGNSITFWSPKNEELADHLLANGVTFAKDTDVPSKWIRVEDDLPELIPCAAGTAYSETVNVLTSERCVLTAIWNGVEFITDCVFWEAEGQAITHWAPVPLPLPELPREDD